MSNPKHDDGSSAIQPLTQTLQLLALTFSILAPCLLIAGYSYYLGYISTFGIDSSLLNRGFGEAITESWIVGIKFLSYLWSIKHYAFLWTLAVIAIVFYVLAIVIKRQKLGLSNAMIDGTLSRENQGPEYLGVSLYRWCILSSSFIELFQIVLWPIGVIAFGLFVCIFPFKDGSNIAENSIEQYQTDQCSRSIETSSSNCITLINLTEDKRVLIEGILVTASKSHIAIYSNNQTEIWPIRDDYKLITNYQPKAAQETEE